MILKYSFQKKCKNFQILICYTYVDKRELGNNGNFPFLEWLYSELQKSVHTYVLFCLSLFFRPSLYEKTKKDKKERWILSQEAGS